MGRGDECVCVCVWEKERERIKQRNVRMEDAFNMQLPEWRCRRIGGNMDVGDIWLGRTADKLSKIVFYVRGRTCFEVYKVFQGVETRTSIVEERERNIHVKFWFTYAEADSPGNGIKSVSKRKGRQLGQLANRDWSRFILHLLLLWRVCKVIFSGGCAVFSDSQCVWSFLAF